LSIRRLPLRRAPALPVFAGCLVVLCAGAVAAQDLARIVPAQAFLVSQARADDSLAFKDAYELEMFHALRDAHLEDLLIETLVAGGAEGEPVEQLRQVIDYVGRLVSSVDWQALARNECVFAMDMRSPLPYAAAIMPSMLVAFRADAADVDRLEKSLRNLMGALAALAPDALSFESPMAGEGATRVHTLRIVPWGEMPVLQFGVHGNELLFAIGDRFFRDALARMEGTAAGSLVDSERYIQAFGDLPRDASRSTFVDVRRLIDDIEAQVVLFLPDDKIAHSIAADFFHLGRIVGTVASTTHAEGHTVFEESWVRFDRESVAEGHPLVPSCRSQASSELLQYVPADAKSFTLMQGMDLAPLYRWGLERFEHYADPQDAEEGLVAWKAVQAVLDIDFERDILGLMRSESITIALPSEKASPMDPGAFVTLVALENPETTRRLVKRLENVYDACIPWLLDRLEREQPGAVPLRIELSDAESSFPGLRRMSTSLRMQSFSLPISDMVYGMVGDKLVFASSDEALSHVMEVAADEAPGLDEHPATVSGLALPEGHLLTAAYTPYAQMAAETRSELRMAGDSAAFVLRMALSGVPDGKEKAKVKAISKVIEGVLPRMQSVLAHWDFMQDGLMYAQPREDGHAVYACNMVRYRTQDERMLERDR